MTNREELLSAYAGLRVTDVIDGMDVLGYRDTGLMDPEVRPVWRDTTAFSHRMYGLAHTVRFVPTQQRVPDQSSEEFYDWMKNWYQKLSPDPKGDDVQHGDVIVIDASGLGNQAPVGSKNTVIWAALGAVGVVTDGRARDTDEIIIQDVPVYAKQIGGTIRPGRIELDGTKVDINCGGARVCPEDVVVADGDGVVVVPSAIAEAVAEQAWRHATDDKATRMEWYERSGRELDWTVKSDAMK